MFLRKITKVQNVGKFHMRGVSGVIANGSTACAR
jgi:hypothetical protein